MSPRPRRAAGAARGIAAPAPGAAASPSRAGAPASRSGARALPHEVRIVGGLYKRSKLPVADRPGLRPTPQRARETLFNWLGQDLSGWSCLDAFAGTGALGFEAASRGAAQVLMLEHDPGLVKVLAASRDRLQAGAVRVERADALAWMRATAQRFDLVLLDPPFGEPALLADALAAGARLVAPAGVLYVEAGSPLTAVPDGFTLWRQARTGAVHSHLLRRSS